MASDSPTVAAAGQPAVQKAGDNSGRKPVHFYQMTGFWMTVFTSNN
ncbi:hypothetical protein SIAM614_19316 [Stappia aggregata IAM 12614]|uniref:Uncharacterized protein n=1 Tax=Roseibium aggregatum (strain ATCC 25650 / DSM 13394 / JCM 20685 / NBRC 16684 / NCIMB 2208 / IAM 12614 / B1) TaxID=384765 RepID=A0NVJ0_ROSAI|nr:hypothetical protein [Roseibium aggregatum]EAV43005.1 hypothetical protein SIAM614_19316 [Stappia aggregata IAM 12614] [Roseibium aggregatum IAM 12614]